MIKTMKNFKFVKIAFLLIAVVAFSNCEDNGPIQSVVVDEFEFPVDVLGMSGESIYGPTIPPVDISKLLENVSSFVGLKIIDATVTLGDDYSGDKIAGNFTLIAGGQTIFDQSEEFVKGTPKRIDILVKDILAGISSSKIPVTVKGESSTVLGDDDFTIKVIIRVSAIVE